MDIELITPPDEASVLSLLSVADLKKNERVSHSVQDDLFEKCIKMAYATLDGRYGWLKRSILTQTWKLWLPAFQLETELPYGPLQAVSEVQYFDADGVQQTLPVDQYEVLPGEFVPRVVRVHGVSWPTTDNRNRAVSIEYSAGFGSNATGIGYPLNSQIENALRLLASHYYRNPAATYAEPRTLTVNRIVQMGLEHLVGFLRQPHDLG